MLDSVMAAMLPRALVLASQFQGNLWGYVSVPSRRYSQDQVALSDISVLQNSDDSVSKLHLSLLSCMLATLLAAFIAWRGV